MVALSASLGQSNSMILLYTDFGWQGPYVGQMHTVLNARAPGISVIDLMHDAPAFKPTAAGRLLAALAQHFPPQSVCVAVIDPGVGSTRRPVAVQADGHWFVGPDNGLFEYLGSSKELPRWFEITWQPDEMSNSFHGRDLFAPVGAALATNKADRFLRPLEAPSVQAKNLAEIIYIDGYGNAMTGLDADAINPEQCLCTAGESLHFARTFSDVEPGHAFWTQNSLGLIEIAVNQGSAASQLNLEIGSPVS